MTTTDELATPAAALTQWLAAAWAVQAEVRTVTVDGTNVAYRDWRPHGPADGDGLLFVHGFLAHARWWDHIAPHFVDRFQVIASDLTGMGDSGRRPAYSREQFADEIVAVIRAAGLRRTTIVAHSFGSLSSLYAAKLAPELIARVIVLDAHVFRSEPDAPGREVTAEKRYATQQDALARYRLMPPGRWPEPEIVAYIARHSLRPVGDGWGWKFDPQLFARSDSLPVREAVSGLTVPVDFIHAANSDVVGADELAAFLANMPTCGAPVTVPLSHHHLMLEQPVALVAALQGLLAHPRRSGAN